VAVAEAIRLAPVLAPYKIAAEVDAVATVPFGEIICPLERTPDWDAAAERAACILWLDAKRLPGTAVAVNADCAAVFSVRFAEAEWVESRLAATLAVLSAPPVRRVFANSGAPATAPRLGVTVPALPLAMSAAARDCPRLTVPEVVVTAVVAACILPLYVSSAKNDATAVVFAPTLARLSAPPEPVATAVWTAETLALLVSEADVKAVAVKLASPSVNAARITAIADQSAEPVLVVESVIEFPLDQAESNINPELLAAAPPSEGCE
jgi:hypothetical protein